MAKIESRSRVWTFVAMLGLWVCLEQGHEAAAYSSYRGLWEANENEDGRILQQNAHAFTVNIGQDLSNVVSARENINYNNRWVQEVGKEETVSPSATIALVGDSFLANLAVSSLRSLRSQAGQPDSDALGITWGSLWKKEFVPDFRLNYDYSRRFIDTAVNKLDEGRHSAGGEMNWNLRWFQTFYSYRRDESQFTAYQMNQDSHMARINAGKSWLDNRVRISLGHEYNEFRNEQIIPFYSGTTVNVAIPMASIFTGNDPFPEDLDDSMLAVNPLLSPYSIPVGSRNSIRLQQQNLPAVPVERIVLYTQDNLGSNPVAGLGTGNWVLYSNDDPIIDPNNVNWTQVPGISVVYENDIINPRFVITLPPMSARHLKIVVSNQSVTALNLTKIQPEQIFHGQIGNALTSRSSNKSNRTNCSLEVRVNSIVGLYYNYLLMEEESGTTSTNYSEGHNGGLRLQNAAGDLRTDISYGLTRQRYLANPESETQTYLLNINKVFLPTLSVALSGSHESSVQAGAAIFDRNRYTLYADAKLYPDLVSQIEIMYWEQENYRANGTTSLMDNLRTQLILTSRFLPSLVMTFTDIYEVQNQDSKVINDRNTMALTGSWQLSEWFSMNGSVQKEANKITYDAYSYLAGVTVGFGAGLEFQGTYTLQDAAIKTQSGLATLRWSYHQNYSCEVGCNYTAAENEVKPNEYRVYGKIAVNFATR